MKKIKILNLIQSSIYIVLIFSILNAGSLGGPTSYFGYKTQHNVFYNRQSAKGCVRMDNGFTVTVTKLGAESKIGSSIIMDTCVSVSGPIDLRETNTVILLSDLILDSGVTLSSSGRFYGYGKSIILNGDLTIPAGKTIHTGGKLTINGKGHKLFLDNSAQLFVDSDATLTLKNLTLQNTRNQPGHPAVQCASSGSSLCLDNVELKLADDFYFNRGQIFFHNDVAVTGTSAFVYRSTSPSFITPNTTLNFDIGTIFDFRPSTTGTPQLLAKDLLFMQDITSKIYLNGCTLNTTMTGFRLTKGQVLFENKVTISSAAQLQLKSTGTWFCHNYGSQVNTIKFSPDGRYLAVGGNEPTSGNEIQIYRFTQSYLTLVASQTLAVSANIFSIDWSPDGKFIATGEINLNYDKAIKIYSFNGTSLNFITTENYGAYVNSVNWSTDGKFLAVGGYLPTSGNEIQVYSFNGSSLTLVASQDYGDQIFSVNWSTNGKYIAVGGMNPTSGEQLQIYSFSGSSLTLIASKSTGSSDIYSIKWSSDGCFLVVGDHSNSENQTKIYSFRGSTLNLVASVFYGYNGYVYSANWSPDNRYIIIGGYAAIDGKNLKIYKFTGSTLSLVSDINCDSTVKELNWSVDGKYLAVGGASPTSGHDEIEVYTLQYGPETTSQAISNSIVFGNSSLGSNYDLNVTILPGSNINLDGIINYNCIN